MTSRLLNWGSTAALLIVMSPLAAPQLLAFPHSARIGEHRVYSEQPIGPELAAIVEAADRQVARSAIGSARKRDQPVFLTDGGWRWTWLSLPSRSAFAVSRPLVETIVVNRSDARTDQVENGRTIAGRRSLRGTLAHEMTHGSIRSRFGPMADWRYPVELREGYADFVAGGGSLEDREARSLERDGRDVPALTYWRGRKKVEAALRRNGGSVDALFAEWTGD